ncbi:MAG: helix-turn-helix domain-containing protein [Candidatus Hodarchaeales archaeon]|jgi:two-component system response regulator GlrR
MIIRIKKVKTSGLLKPLKETKEDFEKNYIIRILELTRGNVNKASKLIYKNRSDFFNLLKKYNLNPDDFKKS